MTTAELSVLLVWGAMTAYTIAFISYSLVLARKVDDPTRAYGGKAAGIARSTTLVGLALHVAAAVTRGVAAGRVPWANMYEFTLVGVLVAVAVLVLVLRGRPLPFLGVAVMGFSVLALLVALLLFYQSAEGVQPALQSYWLVIHVGVAVIATGIFTVACAVAVLQLWKGRREEQAAGVERPAASGALATVLDRFRHVGRAWAWLDNVPAARVLEALAFRLNAIAFVLWTFTLIAGSIWAEKAWGRFWGWDPKETWTFVIWVIYAAYLHARTTRGWAGRRAAWFVLAGFAAVLANYTIVNVFFSVKHGYSQL